MLDRLKMMEARYNEINDLLMQPETAADVKKLTALSKEQKSLEKVVTLFHEQQKLEASIPDLKEMKKESDPEIVEMATMDYEYTFGTTGEHIIKYTLIDTTTVPNFLFFECEDMTNVAFPDTVTKIGNHAFRGAGVESVNLPQSLTRIGESSFFGCANLKRIIIPDSVTLLGSSAFASCSTLETLVLGNGLTTIPMMAFSLCLDLTYVKIPDSVTIIRDSAFQGCMSLKKVLIGANVEEIGDQAFQFCSELTCDIVLPSSVTYIGNTAFNVPLGSITLSSSTPPTLHKKTGAVDALTLVFGAAGTGQTPTQTYPIYVPSSSLSNYTSADYWSYYADANRIFAAP